MSKKQKIFLPVAVASLIAWLISCQKDPIPEPEPVNPNVPTDTITPVTPGDTIPDVPGGDTLVPGPGGDTLVPGPGGDTIIPGPGGDTLVPGPGGTKEYIVDLLPGSGGWHCFPPVDSVRSWVPCYDTIILFVRAPDNAWTPIGFHAARDSLSKRFNISPKVRGGWWWTPYQILPDADSINHGIKGMIRSDSTQFADWGYGIYPQISKLGKSVQPPRYNGNRALKTAHHQVYKGAMALPRKNCGRGRGE